MAGDGDQAGDEAVIIAVAVHRAGQTQDGRADAACRRATAARAFAARPAAGEPGAGSPRSVATRPGGAGVPEAMTSGLSESSSAAPNTTGIQVRQLLFLGGNLASESFHAAMIC